jgi:hypothetical protein
MKYVRRFGPWAVLALVGCGGTAFTSGPGEPDGSVADDGGSSADASDGALPPADAGPDGASCVTATIRFEVQAASGKSFCIGGNSLACATDWLTVRPAQGGDSLPIDLPCVTQCGACMPEACPASCAAPSELPAGGAMRTWNGTYYAAGTCGNGLACVTPSCALPGRYVATMCGYAKTGPDTSVGACASVSTATCIDVPFAWPPAQDGAVVSGTLGGSPTDAGACCPAGSDLHACTFTDGGTGLACHDPALGCASSTVCGQGCDPVVMGRCADGG